MKFGRGIPLIQGSAPAAGVFSGPGDVGALVRSDGIGKDLLTIIGDEPPLNGRWEILYMSRRATIVYRGKNTCHWSVKKCL